MRYNVSEINSLIKDRRTIYPEFFSERKVHKELINQLLENARWAPTHKLTQPWFFNVFMNDGLLKLSEFQSDTYKKTSGENFKQKKFDKLKNRPLVSSAVIAVSMTRNTEVNIPEIEEEMAVAAAIQNLQLTASAYGLACYWGTGGIVFSPEMKQFLKLAEFDKCLGLIYVGYPKIDWPKSTPRKPLEYVTNYITTNE